MTLTEHTFHGSAIAAGPPNRLAIGLPWFRSTPLSAVVAADLRVDGRAVEDLAFEVDGRTLAVTALAALVDRYWFVQECLTLTWSDPLPAGRDHVEAVLRLRLHLPFLTGPDGRSVQTLQEVHAVVPIERAA